LLQAGNLATCNPAPQFLLVDGNYPNKFLPFAIVCFKIIKNEAM